MTRSEQHQPIARAGFLALLLSNGAVLRGGVLARLRAAVEQPQPDRLELEARE